MNGAGNADGTTAYTIGALGVDSTFYGAISDSSPTRPASLTKVGAGTLTIAGNNTYSPSTTLSGGTLQIGDGGSTGTLPTNNIVNHATLSLNRANAISDSGVISGSGSVIQDGDGVVTFTRNHSYSGPTLINSGTLALTGSGSFSNSSGINIAAGATLDVSGRTGGNLTLTSGKTLSGGGAVEGDFILASGAKLTPGNSLGTLTLLAGSTTTLELTKPPLANDQLKVLGTLTCGGSLVVTNLAPGQLAAGDTFKLFDTLSFSGGFSSIALPPLTGGLSWNTNGLMVDGNIAVVTTAPPAFQSITPLNGGTIQITFTGPTGMGYEVRATTNVALTPLTSWPLIISGTFTGAVITLQDLAATNYSQRYYILRLP